MRSTLVKAQPFGGKSSNSHRFPNRFSFVSFWKIVSKWKSFHSKSGNSCCTFNPNVNHVLVVFLKQGCNYSYDVVVDLYISFGAQSF